MKLAVKNGKTMAAALMMAACAVGMALGTGAVVRADLRATTEQGEVTKIETRLNGSVLEAIVDGLQLAANVVNIIRSIASGDPLGVLTGVIGAYNGPPGHRRGIAAVPAARWLRDPACRLRACAAQLFERTPLEV